jgi:hypothetical protein
LGSYQGKLTVILFFTAALCMGGYAWWHTYQRGRQSLEHWGSDAAVAIRYAKTVEVWQLQRSESSAPAEVIVGDCGYVTSAKTEISNVPGLVHARHALIEDASFLWDWAAADECKSDWQFALHFVSERHTATLIFDPHCGMVALNGSHRPNVHLQPHLMKAYAERATEWLE